MKGKLFRLNSLTMAIISSILIQPTESLALTNCQNSQISAAKKLVYGANGPSGLIGCDIQYKKGLPFNIDDCTKAELNVFRNLYGETSKNSSCTFRFAEDAIADRWSGFVKGFSDTECNDNKCDKDGRKRRRATKIDTVFAIEARRLLDQCNRSELSVRPNFEGKISRLQEALPNLFTTDFVQRKKLMIEGIGGICQDVKSQTATVTTVNTTAGNPIPGNLLNIENAHDGILLKVVENTDESNPLKQVNQAMADWPGAGAIGPVPRSSAEFIFEVGRDIIKAGGGDNENKTVMVSFLDPKSSLQQVLLNVPNVLPVDITPPRPPVFAASTPDSITVSREKKIIKIGNRILDNPADQLSLQLSVVEDFRLADEKHNNTAEAKVLSLIWGKQSIPTAQWSPRQNEAVLVSATNVVDESPIPGGNVTITAALIDDAGNRSDRDFEHALGTNPERVVKKDIQVIHQPPSAVNIAPVLRACNSRNVYNLNANVANNDQDPRWVGIQLPNTILNSDQLSLLFRGGDAQSAPVEVIPLPLSLKEEQRGATIYSRLEFNGSAPDLPEPPATENGVINAIIKNGGESSEIFTSKAFFIDLVAPEKPQIDGPLYSPGVKYEFKITTQSSNDKLTEVTVKREGDSIPKPITDACIQDASNGKLWNCSFNLDAEDPTAPTITASVEDWACNPGVQATYKPGISIPTPRIAVTTASCNDRQVYNRVANSRLQGIVVTVPATVQTGDQLLSRLVNPQPISANSRPITRNDQAETYRLADGSIDLPLAPNFRNGRFASKVRRGIADGIEGFSEDFFVDLKAPVSVNLSSAFKNSETGVCTWIFSPAVNTNDSFPDNNSSSCVKSTTGLICTLSPGATGTFRVQDWACNTSTGSLSCPQTPTQQPEAPGFVPN